MAEAGFSLSFYFRCRYTYHLWLVSGFSGPFDINSVFLTYLLSFCGSGYSSPRVSTVTVFITCFS